MGKCFLVLTCAVFLVSAGYGFDWYTLTQQNYAAVQSGLAELNTAAVQMNQSIYAAQNEVFGILDNITHYMNYSLTDLRSRYPSFTLTTDQLNGMFYYYVYIAGITDQYRKSVTNNVMIPAQLVVRNILDAMTSMYFATNQNCAQNYAPNLVQPVISVGRLKDCILTAIPFFTGLTDTMKSLSSWANVGIDRIVGLRNLCSSGSANCTTKFFSELPQQLNNVIYAVSNVRGVFDTFTQPGTSWTQECVALISADIQDAIQTIQNNIAACSSGKK